MKNKILFSTSNSSSSIFVVFLLFGLFYSVSFVIFNDESVKIIFSLFILLITVFILNKKLFYSIELDSSKGFVYYYPLSFLGDKEFIVGFSEIEKIVYFDYMYKTPSHCSVLSSKGKFSIECSKNEAEKIYSFFKELKIPFEFDSDKEIKFRSGEIFQKKKYN
ncbi:hypothetical protein [Tenacibaculum crassostreae]|uniref:hypothetical protein n=1 Tax=Tenacibaculum crassostreae TaxID=502683 RepID=UPI00389474CE